MFIVHTLRMVPQLSRARRETGEGEADTQAAPASLHPGNYVFPPPVHPGSCCSSPPTASTHPDSRQLLHASPPQWGDDMEGVEDDMEEGGGEDDDMGEGEEETPTSPSRDELLQPPISPSSSGRTLT